MLSNTLNTNEIKDADGVEQEFQRLSTIGRTTEFANITEAPDLPHRLKISHLEIGNGLKKRRRSVIRFDRTVVNQTDSTIREPVSAYVVLDAPIGILDDSSDMKDILANLQSFLSTTGAGTTVLFNGTGNGAVTLCTGGL
jgi:hypothetical protein